MKKLRQNKGITLIALIITIIVMLILVGVTINVALNGGLFQKAEYASEQMQIEAEKEELLSAVMGAIGNDGKIKFGEIQLPEGWSKVADKTYRSPKDNMYKVDDYGKIEYIGKYTGGGNTPVAFSWEDVGLTVDTNTEYICEDGPTLNFSADGILLVLADGLEFARIDATNSDNIDDTTGNISVNIEMDGTPVNATVTMANETDINVTLGGAQIYTCKKTIVDNETIYSNKEVLEALGITNYTGTYNGTWTVIESDASGNPTKLVSTSAVTNYTLGEENNLEKSISDYKTAESALNTAAQEATGISSAESIAIEDIYGIIGNDFIGSGNSDYGRVYNYYYNTEESKVYSKYQTGTDENGEIIWSDPYNTGYSSQTFVDEDGNTVVVDSGNDNVTLTDTYYYYDLTEDQKAEIGTLASGYYWLASPCVNCYSYYAYFYVRYMGNGNISIIDLFNSCGYAYAYSLGVRAVVSVSGL